MKLLGIFLLTILFNSTVFAADKQSAATAINTAVEAFKEVDKLGFSWDSTYSEKIGPAKLLWRKGKYKKAEQLAKEALEQIKMGKEQHRSSLNYGLQSK